MENTINQPRYLFLDAEFGGLEKEKYSLLSVFLKMTDNSFNSVSELYLYLKPDDGIYKVCGEAMNVNRIDLKVHDTRALTYKEGGTKLYEWLRSMTNNGSIKAIVVGHGVYGDVEWILQYLISHGSWEKFCSYRKLDTSVVCQFLKSCGMFPEEVSGSLISLAKYFNIEFDENDCHDAKYDTELTFKVFMALRNVLLNLTPKREIVNDFGYSVVDGNNGFVPSYIKRS